jgi:L-fuculose-phosphate aldolase
MKHGEHVRRVLSEEIVESCKFLNSSGLCFGASGNISVRYHDSILISPSGRAYSTMSPTDVVEIDQNGLYADDRKPSSEWRLHTSIYKNFKSAMAVVHTHSPYAVALACQRRPIPAFHYMVAIAGGNSIRCAQYATFGSEELSQYMLQALIDRSACLLANHGVVVYGRDLNEAIWRAGEVEMLARQYLLSENGGQPVLLTDKQMDEVFVAFADYKKK